jgi:pyridoxal 5'-phosphate synthase pdxT subunit
MKIVVLGLQGAFLEHVECVKRAMAEMKIKGTVIIGKVPADLEGADGIILPGGESTTINRLLSSSGLSDVLKRSKAAILATCAGMVLVSSGGDAQCAHTGGLLGLIDMRVNRNAFGRKTALKRILR